MENTTGSKQVIINKVSAELKTFTHFFLTSRGEALANAQNFIDDNILHAAPCPSEVEEWQYWDGSAWVAAGDDMVLNCVD